MFDLGFPCHSALDSSGKSLCLSESHLDRVKNIMPAQAKTHQSEGDRVRGDGLQSCLSDLDLFREWGWGLLVILGMGNNGQLIN